MPMLIAAAAAAFTAVATAVSAVAVAAVGAIAGAGAAAGLSAGLASFGAALAGASGFAAGLSAWTTVISLGVTVATLIMGAPTPASNGIQINRKLDPQAPIPIAFGRTGTGGYIVYRECWGKNNVSYSSITVLSAGPIDCIESYYMNNYLANTTLTGTGGYDITKAKGRFSHGIYEVTTLYPTLSGSKLFTNNGGQATVLNLKLGQIPEDSFSTATGRPLPRLNSASGMSMLASAYVELQYVTAAFPNGEPAQSWTIRGRPCYDPRYDSSYLGGSGPQRINDTSTWVWTENPAIHALAWLIGFRANGLRAWGVGANFNLIDVPAFIDMANNCDAVGWKSGGVVVTTDDKMAVLNAILQAGSGSAINKGALISCVFSAPKTAIDTLTSSDVVGPIKITNTLAFRDRKNTIIPMYREESSYWNQVAGEAVTSDTYRAADANELKVLEVKYSMVQNAVQAAQLAAYDLANLRENLQMSVVCKPRMINRHPGDCLMVDIPQISNSAIKMVVVSREIEQGFTCNMLLRSETDGKDAFAFGQSPEAPVPVAINIFDPSNPDAPGDGSWTVTGTSVISGNGVTVPAIQVGGAVDDINAESVIFSYSVWGANSFVHVGEFPVSTTIVNITSGIVPGVEYQVAVNYRTTRGVEGGVLLLDPVVAGQYGFTSEAVSTDANGTTLTDTLATLSAYVFAQTAMTGMATLPLPTASASLLLDDDMTIAATLPMPVAVINSP